MKDMVKIQKFLCISLLFALLSCKGNGGESPVETIDVGISDSLMLVPSQSDSSKQETKPAESPANHTDVAPVRSGRNSYRYSSPAPSTWGEEEEEEDNMRGFDPRSEDDLEDNGLSRYMENNDEEGWE